MGITVIGGQSQPIPQPFSSPIIETAQTWTLAAAGAWHYDPELTMVSCIVHASGTISTCEVTRRYGHTKEPYEKDFSDKPPLDLGGQWLRLSFAGDQGPLVQFVGQIENQSRVYTGGFTTPSGKQNWVVSGGLKILQKLVISEAVFCSADESESTVGWIPAMNARDKRGLLVGNKKTSSETADAAPWFYGGTEVWTHAEYIDYLIKNFVQQTNGPTWTVGGQREIIDAMESTIQFSEAITAAEMLRHLIPVQYGVDYRISTTPAGYEITIFALTDLDQNFAGVAMPKNPNSVKILRTGDVSVIETHIVDSTERRVDRVQVCGRRIVVCGTLRGDQAGGVSLVKKWSDDLEADYILANNLGNADPTDLDKAREREVYRDVYQHLGAPLNWDLDGEKWAVTCKDDGTLTTTPNFQTVVRRTLPWIPLKEGFDYSTDPPTDNTLGDPSTSDTKPMMAWLFDPLYEDKTGAIAPRYIAAEYSGVGIHAPHDDWGVFLHAKPNHLLAYNQWSSDQLATTNHEPKYDYNHTVCTIAVESDHRLKLGYKMPAALAAGDGSEMTIIDEQAECWVLLPNTAIDVDKYGKILYGSDQQKELRNDKDRLALIMAGAVSKYINERWRATATIKGFLPWAGLVGNILTIVQEGDDVQRIGAPITSVEWILSPAPVTIVKAGYA